MVTKAQGATGGVAALTVAGVGTGIALTNEKVDSQSSSSESEEDLDKDDSITTYLQSGITVLSSEDDFSSKYSNQSSNQTLGGLYGGYFVGTYGKGDSNKNWWDESYKIWESSKSDGNLSSEFSQDKLSSSFVDKNGSDSDRALNKVCEKIYKKPMTEIKFKDYKYGEEGNDNDKKLIRDTMKYCSPMRKVPKTVEETGESSYGANSIGLTKKDTLASVTDTSNNIFWKLRNDDFLRNNSNYWSGSLLSSKSNVPADLKDLYSQRSSSNESSDIKRICIKNYSISGLSSNHSELYVYYCSWNLPSS